MTCKKIQALSETSFFPWKSHWRLTTGTVIGLIVFMSGVFTCSYLEFLQSLEEKIDHDWSGISSSLEEIRKSLLSRKGCLINMTSEGENLTNSENYICKFLDLLPSSSPVEKTTWSARLSSENEAIVIPTQVKSICFVMFVLSFCLLFHLITFMSFQVNYVGKAFNIYDTGYELKGSAYVISKYISNTWLWDRVRVSGGAYGGFCDFDTHSGTISFCDVLAYGFDC